MSAKSVSKEENTEKSLEEAIEKLSLVRTEIGKVIFGQEKVVEHTLITLMSGGHALLIGVPGLAKTLLVDTIAGALGLDSNRVQCTPDLMPSDVLGSEVLEESDGRRSFRFIEGPVFSQFLMVDEINRASPRTQSALLQAMQEGFVTVSGRKYPLPSPFHVLATQNPIEQEGTYPLPEAQLDRFLMQIDVDYPDLEAEKRIIMETTTTGLQKPKVVTGKNDLANIQKLVMQMPIGEKVVESILALVRKGRPGKEASDMVKEYVVWPPGPRAAQSLMLATRAKALLDGRSSPSVDDVIDLALPVLKHRMSLNYRARGSGVTLKDVISDMCKGL